MQALEDVRAKVEISLEATRESYVQQPTHGVKIELEAPNAL